MKINAPHGKFEVVSWIYETLCVAKMVADCPWKYFFCLLVSYSSSCHAPAGISLTLYRHFSLSFIASGRSSGLYPVSSQSCYMYVRAGHPAFVRPCEGVHRRTSLMSSSPLLQPYPACLVRLTLIVFLSWPYSCCFVGRCLQGLLKIARSILV